MSEFVGRTGSHRVYSYPDAPRPGALVRLGYDQIVEDVTIPAGGEGARIPRNVAGDPLQVAFPSFTDGDVLEVDFRMTDGN